MNHGQRVKAHADPTTITYDGVDMEWVAETRDIAGSAAFMAYCQETHLIWLDDANYADTLTSKSYAWSWDGRCYSCGTTALGNHSVGCYA